MTTYVGQPALIVPAASVPILSSTDATPIVIQTNGNHGLLTGQYVDISGHTVNVNANGVSKVVVNDATHFQLVGSVGTGAGAGGATGQSQSLGLGGFTQTQDAPAPTATQINAPDQNVADQAAFLALATGAYKIVQANSSARANDPPFSAWNTFTIVAQNTWTPSAGPTVFAVAGAQFADIVIVDFEFSAQVLVNTGGGGVQAYAAHSLFVSDVRPGQADNYTRIIGSSRLFNSMAAPGAGVQPTTPIHIKGVYFVAGGGNTLKFQLQALYNNAILPSAWVVLGEYSIAFQILRPTGMPQ